MGHCVGDAATYWAFVARYGIHRNGYGCAPFHQLYMYSVQRSVLCHKRIIARILLSLNFHRGKEAVPAKRCLGPPRGITQPLHTRRGGTGGGVFGIINICVCLLFELDVYRTNVS